MWVLVSQRYSEKSSLTPRSVSLRGVTYIANISAKTNLSTKPFYPAYQGPRWVSFIKMPKNIVTLPL